MAQLSGKKITFITPHYENYLCVDKYGKTYYLNQEEIRYLLKQALKTTTFRKKLKRTRTWLTPIKRKTKKV